MWFNKRKNQKQTVVVEAPQKPEPKPNVYNDIIFSMPCPNCGATMELRSGSSGYECPYCHNKFYIYSEKQLELVGMNFVVPKIPNNAHLDPKYVQKQVTHQAALRLAEQLIEKGYVKIDKLPELGYYDTWDSQNDKYRFLIKIVKQEG